MQLERPVSTREEAIEKYVERLPVVSTNAATLAVSRTFLGFWILAINHILVLPSVIMLCIGMTVFYTVEAVAGKSYLTWGEWLGVHQLYRQSDKRFGWRPREGAQLPLGEWDDFPRYTIERFVENGMLKIGLKKWEYLWDKDSLSGPAWQGEWVRKPRPFKELSANMEKVRKWENYLEALGRELEQQSLEEWSEKKSSGLPVHLQDLTEAEREALVNSWLWSRQQQIIF